MILEERRIGDLIKLQRGHDLPSSKRNSGTVPIISSSGITDYHDEYKAKGEGVITGRYGTLGEVFYVNSKYWPLNTALYVKEFKGNYPKFIYYFLKTIHLERYNGAAAVPGLDRNVIHKLKVKVPTDLPTQKKIASILSAYDDLIENNNQRIQLLEEMAEDIYKEWFVRMRFPATENSPSYKESKFFDKEGKEVEHGTVGALPEGWEKVAFSKVADIEWGDTNVTKASYIEKGYTAYSAAGPDGFLNYFDFDRSGIVLSAIGANCGRTFYANGKWSCIKNTIRFFSNDGFNIDEYLFLATKDERFFPKRGAAQPFIGLNDAKNTKILLPNRYLCNLFRKIVNPFFLEKSLLIEKNQVLQETRDLLLPRLISGKLSVEGLEIESKESLGMAAEPEVEYK